MDMPYPQLSGVRLFIQTSVAAELKMSGGKASGSKQHEETTAMSAPS
jgi:hypothetical protein